MPRIPGYRVVRLLGEGASGTVWEAVQPSTHRRVALKVLRSHHLGSASARKRFEREVRLAARLEHPHVARVYTGGVHRGVPYYAMELVEGLPLDRYAEAAALETLQTLRLAHAVCLAVGYAHGRGIVHRDLKPSNILVTPAGEPRVLDFGLARALGESAAEAISLDGEVAGTPAFMSPEQASGKPADVRSDVYSLGVILYRLLLRESPYDLSGGPLDVMRRVVSEEVRRPRAVAPGLDDRVEAVLLKALAKDPASRYASATAFAADLAAYLDGGPMSAVPFDSDDPLDPERLLRFFNALRRGDLSARLPAGTGGRASEAAAAANGFVQDLSRLTGEIVRVLTELHEEGRLGGWLQVLPQYGQWKRLSDAVNGLAGALTERVRDVNRTLHLAAGGDLSRKLTGDLHGEAYRGELLELKTSLNALIDRLRAEAAGRNA